MEDVSVGDGTNATAKASVAARVSAVVIVATASLLFNLRPLSLAMPAPDLDGSWMVVLGRAATIPSRWGVDLAFTYGPASALVTRYFTEGYLALAVPATLSIALVLGLCFGRLSTIAVEHHRRASLLLVLAAAVQAAGLLAAAHAPDNVYFVFAFCIFLLDLVRPARDRFSRLVVVAGAVAMGGVALSKTSYGVLALALFALSDLRSAMLLRRTPILVLPLVVSFLLLFGGFGQRYGDLPAYLVRQGEVAAGYGAAMYAPGSARELGGFVAAALALLAVQFSGPLRADRFRGATAVAGSALLLLLAFKAAFVRQDAHTQIGWTTLGLSGLAVAAALVLRRSTALAGAMAATSLAALWLVGPLLLGRSDREASATGLAAVYADIGQDVSDEAGAWGRFLTGPGAFRSAARADEAAAFAAVREQSPLPKLEGTVDIIPSAQTSVLANGLDYHPRPSFQDYSTYTAGLIDANVAFYRGASAPDWVLFGIGGLDDRYPTSTEGGLWPDLLRRYEPVRRAGSLLALHRRAVPLPDVLGSPRDRSVLLGHDFDVPPGPTYARIVVRETLLGRVAATLFRPPALALRVRLANGGDRSARFIPALGAGGFLISPYVETADEYGRLATGGGDVPAGKTVVEAAVTGSRFARLFYTPEISIELYPVHLVGDGSEPRSRVPDPASP